MSFEKNNRFRGELLRQWREMRSVDIAVLARQVNMSVAQLQQLESDELAPGERPLFYSETIKANAAKKVATTLGADLKELFAVSPGEQASGKELMHMQVLDDLAALLEKQKQARHAAQGRHFWRSRLLWSVLALCVAGALVWHFQNVLSTRVHGWFLAARQAASPEMAPAPSVSEPPSSDASLVPNEPLATVAQDSKLSLADALCRHQVLGDPLKASSPSKAGNMVYIMAEADASVCVQDAAGKKFAVDIKAQESRSFYGAAPWTVHVDKSSSVHLFFQGQRLRWPEGEQNSMTLQEVKGAY